MLSRSFANCPGCTAVFVEQPSSNQCIEAVVVVVIVSVVIVRVALVALVIVAVAAVVV
jgi:hypothetical protein